jgi:hypothetical protein
MAAPNTKGVAALQPKVGGGVYYAPIGTALPVDATTSLVAAYIGLGFVSDAGVTPTRDTSIDKVKAWGGDVVAALLTDESESFEFTLIELYTKEVSQFIYGTTNVVVTAPVSGTGEKLAVSNKGGKPAQCIFVFDMRYGAKSARVVVPVADPVVTGEEPWQDTGLAAYTVTVEALKDTSGVRVYRYTTNDNPLP